MLCRSCTPAPPHRTHTHRFKEEVALRERMQGIASIIASSGYPTFICLQEVTANILRLFSSMAW